MTQRQAALLLSRTPTGWRAGRGEPRKGRQGQVLHPWRNNPLPPRPRRPLVSWVQGEGPAGQGVLPPSALPH